jgi:wobble nucleotide-excising tRNase
MEELEKRFLALYDDTQQTLDNINKIEYLLTSFENHLILKKNIIGKNDVDISKLITQLDNADWVNQGRKYVKDEICPFCQQHTLKDSLKQQFDDFFDETYNDSITKLKEVKENYNKEKLFERAKNHQF